LTAHSCALSTSLASSLPSHSLNAHAEKALLDNFKAAALSITTLYRSSRHASKRAYNSGYAAACRDLMEMLQLGVSDSQMLVGQSVESGMTVGRVMDWVEARLEAVRAREEEEDEEDGVTATSSSTAPPPRKPSPSPPPSRLALPSPPRPSIPLKPARHNKLGSSPPNATSPPPEAASFSFAENMPPPLAGSKRRHALMMMPTPSTTSAITTAPSSSSSTPSPMSHAQAQRRRTRSTRGLFPLNQVPMIDTLMDVEDEGGRERKRIARR
ncbi:hypothetical protein C8F01DRAFT_1165588, partial [Mycena amicta]